MFFSKCRLSKLATCKAFVRASRLAIDDFGAAAVEYAVITGLVVVVSIASIQAIGDSATNTYKRVVSNSGSGSDSTDSSDQNDNSSDSSSADTDNGKDKKPKKDKTKK